MRIRAVIVLFLSFVGLSLGCRNALSPNVDRNHPPETWLTGAPMDSITTRGSGGGRDPAQIHTIPIRFHMYWAGSDQDGAVVGYYWAVVETLPQPIEGTNILPPLPGPRANQYHFTTKTDSVFVFNVSEFAPDRQHAFFIYAVDDKGKADPTPARFIFNALDRFPPLPIFDVASATGKVWRVKTHGVPTSTDSTTFIRDSLDLNDLGRAPRDTVLSNARIDFHWHGEPTAPGQVAVRYKYKLDESFFNDVDSSVHAVSYNTGINGDVVHAGTKLFYFRAIDAAGGARQINRRFQVGYDPDTWFAGPDSNSVGFATDPDDNEQHRFITVNDWGTQTNCTPCQQPPLTQTLLSCDSLTLWPSERKQNKTFWEIYRNRLYLHVEGDTVNMNSWIIVSNGGSDIDSPYSVDVQPNDPVNVAGCAGSGEPPRVVQPSTAVGSPIGFRFQTTNALDPDQTTLSTPSQSALYPTFDAASTFRAPFINAYMSFNLSGKVYLIVHAIDGDLSIDDRLLEAPTAKRLADRVDAGMGTPNEVALRSRILTFYVNKSPYFNFASGGFFPKPPEFNGGVTASSPDRVLHLSLLAGDPDPYDRTSTPTPGGPSVATTFRTQVTVHGTYTQGGVTRDTTYAAPAVFNTTNQTIDMTAAGPASYITGTHLTLDIQLCDCINCESQPGSGRCIRALIPIDVPPLSAAAASPLGPTGTNRSTPSGRSYTP